MALFFLIASLTERARTIARWQAQKRREAASARAQKLLAASFSPAWIVCLRPAGENCIGSMPWGVRALLPFLVAPNPPVLRVCCVLTLRASFDLVDGVPGSKKRYLGVLWFKSLVNTCACAPEPRRHADSLIPFHGAVMLCA